MIARPYRSRSPYFLPSCLITCPLFHSTLGTLASSLILKHAGQTGLRAFELAVHAAWKAPSPDISVAGFLIVFWYLKVMLWVRPSLATVSKISHIQSLCYVSLLYFFFLSTHQILWICHIYIIYFLPLQVGH